MVSIRSKVALNHKKTGRYPDITTKNKSFINKFNWKINKLLIRKR